MAEEELEPGEDYLVTDSKGLPDAHRPSVAEALSNPRDGLALVLLANGLAISALNLCGEYSEPYLALEVSASSLGFLSGAAALAQLATGYMIRPHRRRGIADDGLVTLYGGLYSLAVSWLALRASDACPPLLWPLDPLLSAAAVATFLFGIAAPLATLLWPSADDRDSFTTTATGTTTGSTTTTTTTPPPPLSPTELLRVRGLVALGALGAVFIPDCVAFGLGGEAWWGRVANQHAAQRTLESSTALFALFATEASMVAHRAGKVGVAPFARLVPAFLAVCFALAVVPCVAALVWLGDDISFFSFYRE